MPSIVEIQCLMSDVANDALKFLNVGLSMFNLNCLILSEMFYDDNVAMVRCLLFDVQLVVVLLEPLDVIDEAHLAWLICEFLDLDVGSDLLISELFLICGYRCRGYVSCRCLLDVRAENELHQIFVLFWWCDHATPRCCKCLFCFFIFEVVAVVWWCWSMTEEDVGICHQMA